MFAVTFIMLSRGVEFESHAFKPSVTENCDDMLPSLVFLLDTPQGQRPTSNPCTRCRFAAPRNEQPIVEHIHVQSSRGNGVVRGGASEVAYQVRAMPRQSEMLEQFGHLRNDKVLIGDLWLGEFNERVHFGGVSLIGR